MICGVVEFGVRIEWVRDDFWHLCRESSDLNQVKFRVACYRHSSRLSLGMRMMQIFWWFIGSTLIWHQNGILSQICHQTGIQVDSTLIKRSLMNGEPSTAVKIIFWWDSISWELSESHGSSLNLIQQFADSPDAFQQAVLLNYSNSSTGTTKPHPISTPTTSNWHYINLWSRKLNFFPSPYSHSIHIQSLPF